MHKASKASVSYDRGHRESHCGHSFEGDTFYCRHFQAPPSREIANGTCQKVEGQIGRIMWCKLWVKAQTK